MSPYDLSPGDPWPEHYRGLTLHANANGEIWWRPYRGEQRLYVDDPPEDLVINIQEYKPYGAQFRVTEHNDVIAKIQDEDEGTYDPIYLGRFESARQLVPKQGGSEFAIDLHPDDRAEGELWPSIYDGSRYSLTSPDKIWWHNPDTHRRHPVEAGISQEVARNITFYKSQGGSFRVTPWGDVITLIDTVPRPEQVMEQFAKLPRVVQNIIQLRKDRDLDMLPVYVGTIGNQRISLGEPRDLTDDLSDAAQTDIESWIKSLGPTSSASDVAPLEADDEPHFDDDPDDWASDVVEEHSNDV